MQKFTDLIWTKREKGPTCHLGRLSPQPFNFNGIWTVEDCNQNWTQLNEVCVVFHGNGMSVDGIRRE